MDTPSQAVTQAPGSLDRYIVSTPGVLGGKPRIAGHRIGVTHIKAYRLARGMTEAEIAEAFDLPLAAVYAAMAYYYEHKAEIDAQDDAEEALVADLKAKYPSKLRAKLDSSTNE